MLNEFLLLIINSICVGMTASGQDSIIVTTDQCDHPANILTTTDILHTHNLANTLSNNECPLIQAKEELQPSLNLYISKSHCNAMYE